MTMTMYLFFLLFLFYSGATGAPPNTWSSFERFLNAQRGNTIEGISELKQYLHRFGYLNNNTIVTDIFDAHFESALVKYQTQFGLPTTGKLDSITVSQIMLPRCGVSDGAATRNLHVKKKFAYFPGKPRWTKKKPMKLTYALSTVDYVHYLDVNDVKSILQRAFTQWAAVIPVSFEEVMEYRTADIKVGFYKGDHGDGEPFDGVLGVLGHAFSPQSGKFHLDGDETWAVDFGSEKAKEAIDLESVMTHEIGHVLGLAHSSNKEAVMYASLSPRTKKVNLRLDDVKGVQALYGSNPNFRFNSLLVSDTSSAQAIPLRPKNSIWVFCLILVILSFNLIR